MQRDNKVSAALSCLCWKLVCQQEYRDYILGKGDSDGRFSRNWNIWYVKAFAKDGYSKLKDLATLMDNNPKLAKEICEKLNEISKASNLDGGPWNLNGDDETDGCPPYP